MNEALPATAHLQLHAFRDRKDAQQDNDTAQGSAPDDLDESSRFMHHESEFRGVPHNLPLDGGDEHSFPRSRKQQGDVELPRGVPGDRVRGPTDDQEVSGEHREDTRKCVHHSEVSTRHEPSQRSDVRP